VLRLLRLAYAELRMPLHEGVEPCPPALECVEEVQIGGDALRHLSELLQGHTHTDALAFLEPRDEGGLATAPELGRRPAAAHALSALVVAAL